MHIKFYVLELRVPKIICIPLKVAKVYTFKKYMVAQNIFLIDFSYLKQVKINKTSNLARFDKSQIF